MQDRFQSIQKLINLSLLRESIKASCFSTAQRALKTKPLRSSQQWIEHLPRLRFSLKLPLPPQTGLLATMRECPEKIESHLGQNIPEISTPHPMVMPPTTFQGWGCGTFGRASSGSSGSSGTGSISSIRSKREFVYGAYSMNRLCLL